MFEWLQLAGLRFLAVEKGEDAAGLRWSLFAAGLLSSLALVLVGGAASLTSTLAPRIVVLGLAVAALQGIVDMYFMMIRLSDRLGTAALLLVLRASLLLAGAVCGAGLYKTSEATLLAIVFGHAAALVAGFVVYRTPVRKGSPPKRCGDWAEFLRYRTRAA